MLCACVDVLFEILMHKECDVSVVFCRVPYHKHSLNTSFPIIACRLVQRLNGQLDLFSPVVPVEILINTV